MLNLPPINKASISQAVQEIIDQTGQPIFFKYIQEYAVCPTCGGTDPFCPTCNGNDVVAVVESIEYTGTITWKDSQHRKFRRGGWQEMDGDCLVVIHNDGLLYELLKRVKKAVIGASELIVKSFHYGGLDNNRLYVNLVFDTDGTDRIG